MQNQNYRYITLIMTKKIKIQYFHLILVGILLSRFIDLIYIQTEYFLYKIMFNIR